MGKINYDKLELNQLLPLYIGRIAQEWAETEYQLAGLLARMAGIKSGIADIIISTIGGNKVQRDLILSIATYRRAPPETMVKIKSLMRRCSKAAKKRNTLVHALYLSRNEKNFLALKDASILDFDESEADKFVINKAWLDAALNQIIKLGLDIHQFTEAIGGSHCWTPTALLAEQRKQRHRRPAAKSRRRPTLRKEP